MEIIKETKSLIELTQIEIDKIFDLMKPYYVNPSALIERDLNHCTDIYFLKDKNENLLSFFMVGWEKHIINSEERDVVFLGLSCANDNYNERRFASKVYYYFTQDAFDFEQNRNTKLILYGTTATPVVLLTLEKIWANVKPNLFGEYEDFDKIVIEAIKKKSGFDKYSTNHPFVLKGIAVNTKYSQKEEERLNEVIRKNNIEIFKTLNIDESNGDRLLITCNIPDKAKLDRLKSKLFE